MAKYVYKIFGVTFYTKIVIEDDYESEDETMCTDVSASVHLETNVDPVPPMFGFMPFGPNRYDWNE
jgi:hypothetical protein